MWQRAARLSRTNISGCNFVCCCVCVCALCAGRCVHFFTWRDHNNKGRRPIECTVRAIIIKRIFVVFALASLRARTLNKKTRNYSEKTVSWLQLLRNRFSVSYVSHFFRSCRLILTVLCIFESHQNWATHKTSKFLAALGRTFSLHFSTQQFLELWGLWPLLSLAFTVKINNFTRFYYGFRLFRTVWIMIFDIVFLGPLIIMLGDVFGVWVG